MRGTGGSTGAWGGLGASPGRPAAKGANIRMAFSKNSMFDLAIVSKLDSAGLAPNAAVTCSRSCSWLRVKVSIEASRYPGTTPCSVSP